MNMSYHSVQITAWGLYSSSRGALLRSVHGTAVPPSERTQYLKDSHDINVMVSCCGAALHSMDSGGNYALKLIYCFCHLHLPSLYSRSVTVYYTITFSYPHFHLYQLYPYWLQTLRLWEEKQRSREEESRTSLGFGFIITFFKIIGMI